MDIEKIKQRIQRFSDDRNWESFHNPKNLVMALNGEVGELNEIFQWLNFEECMNFPVTIKKSIQKRSLLILLFIL